MDNTGTLTYSSYSEDFDSKEDELNVFIPSLPSTAKDAKHCADIITDNDADAPAIPITPPPPSRNNADGDRRRHPPPQTSSQTLKQSTYSSTNTQATEPWPSQPSQESSPLHRQPSQSPNSNMNMNMNMNMNVGVNVASMQIPIISVKRNAPPRPPPPSPEPREVPPPPLSYHQSSAYNDKYKEHGSHSHERSGDDSRSRSRSHSHSHTQSQSDSRQERKKRVARPYIHTDVQNKNKDEQSKPNTGTHSDPIVVDATNDDHKMMDNSHRTNHSNGRPRSQDSRHRSASADTVRRNGNADAVYNRYNPTAGKDNGNGDGQVRPDQRSHRSTVVLGGHKRKHEYATNQTLQKRRKIRDFSVSMSPSAPAPLRGTSARAEQKYESSLDLQDMQELQIGDALPTDMHKQVMERWRALDLKAATFRGLNETYMNCLEAPSDEMKSIFKAIIERMNVLGTVVPYKARGIALTSAILQRIDLKEKLDGNQNDEPNIEAANADFVPRVRSGDRRIQAIVISPTRVQAHEMHTIFSNIGRFWQLNITRIMGGMDETHICRRLSLGLDVVSGTPGKFCGMIRSGKLKKTDFAALKVVCLDEADALVTKEDFREQLRFLFNQLSDDIQCVQLSSMFTENDRSDARHFMRDMPHIQHRDRAPSEFHESLDIETRNIQHEVRRVRDLSEKLRQVRSILQYHRSARAIIFFGKRSKCKRLFGLFERKCVNQDRLAGRTAQHWMMIGGGMNHAEMLRKINQFEAQPYSVCCTTDMLSRGQVLKHCSVVINFDLPNAHQPKVQTYMTRCQKIGPAMKTGYVYTFVAMDSVDDEIMRSITEFFTHIDFRCSRDAAEEQRRGPKQRQHYGHGHGPGPGPPTHLNAVQEQKKKQDEQWLGAREQPPSRPSSVSAMSHVSASVLEDMESIASQRAAGIGPIPPPDD